MCFGKKKIEFCEKVIKSGFCYVCTNFLYYYYCRILRGFCGIQHVGFWVDRRDSRFLGRARLIDKILLFFVFVVKKIRQKLCVFYRKLMIFETFAELWFYAFLIAIVLTFYEWNTTFFYYFVHFLLKQGWLIRFFLFVRQKLCFFIKNWWYLRPLKNCYFMHFWLSSLDFTFCEWNT